MNNEIILTTSLDEFIAALLTVHSPHEEYTIGGTPDEQQRNIAHALQTKGLLTMEQTAAKQYVLQFTEAGLKYIRDHFDFTIAPEAGENTADKEEPEETPRRRGPIGRKLDGVLKMFKPLAAQTVTKIYKGRTLTVEIAADGSCAIDNAYYTSLSKAAAAVTGQNHINGRKFFGIGKTSVSTTATANA